MGDTRNFKGGDRTRRFTRPKKSQAKQTGKQASRVKEEKAKKPSREDQEAKREYVYRDDTDRYDFDDLDYYGDDQEEEGGSCMSSCSFGCFLVVVAILSFLFAGFVVFFIR